MEVFLFCLVSVLVCEVFVQLLPVQKKRKRQLFALFIFVLLFLFSALRADCVGGDLSNYIPVFQDVKMMNGVDVFHRWEPGFMLFLKIISYVSIDTRWFLFATSVLIMTLMSFYIYKNSPMLWMSVLLFIVLGYYSNTMNIIRHSIALAITLNSINDIVYRNFKGFVLKILLASLFQITSFVFILAYACSYFKFSYFKYILAIIVSVIVVSMGKAMSLMLVLISIFMSKYDGFTAMDSEIGSGYALACFMAFFVWFLRCIYLYLCDCVDVVVIRKVNVYFNLQLFGIVFQCFFAPVFGAASRIAIFYFCPLIILAPYIISMIRDARFKFLSIVGVIAMVFVFYMYTGGVNPETLTNSDMTLPYYFFWQVPSLY